MTAQDQHKIKKMKISPFSVFLWLCISCSFAIVVYISSARFSTNLINFKARRFQEPPIHDQSKSKSSISNRSSTGNQSGECDGRYIYIHKLPPRFNLQLLRNCKSLNPFSDDMCTQLENSGLGPHLDGPNRALFKGKSWYSTLQFSLELIFHTRMKRYKCLTEDSTSASAVFVPFYAGLDVGRFLWDANLTKRDALALDLAEWLRSQPQWDLNQGRDHFMVAGRITWDFRRVSNEASDWGSKLLLLPELNNMTSLVIESNLRHSNEVSIPYPTYFHPSTWKEMVQWQRRVSRYRRRYLFSFAGSPRPGRRDSIRNQVITQCLDSAPKCKLLRCDRSSCDNPLSVMRLFMSSVFCLQPPGDSYTRRSAFDSMLGGCIPVFFHPDSAYHQYSWHLPRDHASYSVFISMVDVKSGNVSIQKQLSRIPRERVKAMRQQVVGLIPRLVYANPMAKEPNLGFQDAFDIAVNHILNRVKINDSLQGLYQSAS